MMKREVIDSVIKKSYRAICEKDIDALKEVTSENAKLYSPTHGAAIMGHRDFGTLFDYMSHTYKKYDIRKSHVFYGDSEAAVEFIVEGVGVDGEIYEKTGIDIFEIDSEGKLSTLKEYPAEYKIDHPNKHYWWNYWDMTGNASNWHTNRTQPGKIGKDTYKKTILIKEK